ncbi:cysteine-rich receptor-like protein kinase 25 [Malus sylvestris]|uniref:cysteine-rich receptor-like protein kinase 25 n=1 Tax=Malus sylvestris TaxID=3752 RepID=UPI0021ABD05C|nr:cysteine-rich receptor-like protein kinase 25 [Malus sylvestris]
MKNMTTVLLIFSIFTLPSFLTSTEAEYLYHVCPNTTTFTPNSTFQSNLNRLFSTLSSNAYRSTGFYNTSVQTPNNAVYGLFLCRGDVLGTDACETCVANATSEAPQRCPIEKEAVIWYDDCMLRYSYVSFFSTSAENPGVFLMNTQNVTEQTRFNQVLAASMNEVATEAANDAYKFATKQTKFSDLITLYSLGQCTQDLSAAVCDECLRDVIALLPSCCSGKQGGRVLLPSCSVRYEIYPFYAQNATAHEPTPTKAVYLDEYCPDTTTFTPNSAFQSNLKRLLSTLSSEATRYTGFYKDTASSSQNPYDTVYGLFLCRGDLVSTDECKTCVATATSEALERCPNRKNVIIWYVDCMLRYSDESFFSRLDDIPLRYLGNKTKVTANESRFYQVLEASVNELAVQASNKSNMFATKKADVSGSISLQVLGQCTQDLSSRDCYLCLQGAIAEVPRIQQGGRLLCPSCRLTIEVYRYILRTPSSPPPLPPPPASIRARPKGRSRLSPYIIIIGSILAFIAVTVVLVYCFASRRAVRNNAPSQENVRDDTETLESLQFDLGTIETATNKFSDNNKLGEGGFGVVFKGTLANEQEIAVKRLSKSSKQGVQEFKNEVALVAKLQHRNLVRLLGFCLEGEETILVYEYVTNQSLDYFLFESKKREQLDWSRRCMIIGGITQGIVYLHEYSRLRVIHRDLKASNILLDENMNPKISDFGMARMFGADDQTQGNTERIVGTYGYMAPEYAMEGLYSIKFDVFSFGVLLLEIITGRKNFLGFHLTNGAPTLIGNAWKLWNEGKVLELMDPLLKGSCSPNEFLRYVHIGLLCVQEDANNRPTMSSVVLMLKSETIGLSKPERPAFFTGRCIDHHDQVAVSAHNCSVNGLTISNVVAR